MMNVSFIKAGVHFRAKRAKDFCSTVFAKKKDYIIKKFRANKKKMNFFQPLRQIWPMYEQWECFFFRLTK